MAGLLDALSGDGESKPTLHLFTRKHPDGGSSVPRLVVERDGKFSAWLKSADHGNEAA